MGFHKRLESYIDRCPEPSCGDVDSTADQLQCYTTQIVEGALTPLCPQQSMWDFRVGSTHPQVVGPILISTETLVAED